MATLVVTAGTIADASGMSNQQHLIYAVNSGVWYLFYIDSTTTTVIKSKVSSSADLTTATWAASTSTPALPAAASHRSDSRDIGIGYLNNAGTDVVWVHTFDNGGVADVLRGTLSASAITYGAWVSPGTNAATPLDPLGPTVGFGSDNFVSILGQDISAGMNIGAERTTSADTNAWSAAVDIEVVTNQNTSSFTDRIDASGNMVGIYDNAQVGGNFTVLDYNKTVTQAWQTTGAAAGIAVAASTQSNDWSSVRIDDTHFYTLTRSGDATTAWLFSLYDGNATWTAKTAPAAQASVANSGIHIATDGTNVWAFIVDTDAANTIRYNKYTVASNTWGGWTALETTTQVRKDISGYKTASNGQIGVIYTQTNGSNFDIYVTAITLAVAAAVADPTFVDNPRSMGRGPLAFTRRQRAYYSPGRYVYDFGGAQTDALAGSPIGVGVTTGALSVKHNLGTGPIGVSATTAALSVANHLGSGPIGVGVATAALSVKNNLGAGPIGVGVTTAALSVKHALATGPIGVGAATTALSVSNHLATANVGVGRVTANLSVSLGTKPIGVGLVTASLSASKHLTVSLTGIGVLSAPLTVVALSTGGDLLHQDYLKNYYAAVRLRQAHAQDAFYALAAAFAADDITDQEFAASIAALYGDT